MRGMPPVHFHMKFTIPAVIGEPCFLRWCSARTLYTGKVLRQYNTALQFLRTRICTTGEISRSAAFPEILPECAVDHGDLLIRERTQITMINRAFWQDFWES